MTCDPYASLHLGLSAEAMVLIDPQLGDSAASGSFRQRVLLPVIFAIALLMLLPGAPIIQESGFRQLAQAMECASRCHQPPMNGAPVAVVSL